MLKNISQLIITTSTSAALTISIVGFAAGLTAHSARAQYDGYEVDVEEQDLLNDSVSTQITKKPNSSNSSSSTSNRSSLNSSNKKPSLNSQNKIVIVNSPSAAAKSSSASINKNSLENAAAIENTIQDQGTTTVEASPLVNSRAQQLRKKRESIEVDTEQRIVEKLEESRISDEAKRADRLFGDRLEAPIYDPYSSYPQKPQQTAHQQTQVSEQQNLQPQTAVTSSDSELKKPQQIEVVVKTDTPAKKEESRDLEESSKELKKETKIKNELKAETAALVQDEPQGLDRSYMSADVGVAEYPSAVNIKGNFAGGVGFGVDLPSRVSVEGRFKYSNYDLEILGSNNQPNTPSQFMDVDQYNVSVGARYRLLDTSFSPIAGALIGYTYRSYTDKQDGLNNSANSNAFDIGFNIGADFKINTNFSLGLDFNYMKNLSYRVNTSSPSSIVSKSSNALETFDYYFVTLSGKFYF